MEQINYQDINRHTIDRWVEEGWQWGKPVSHEEYVRAVNGVWDVYLTPKDRCRTNGSGICEVRRFWDWQAEEVSRCRYLRR